MNENHSVSDAIRAVQLAQEKTNKLDTNPLETQNQLEVAEELIINAHLNNQDNIEDRHRLQQASELLLLLKETYQAYKTK
ncbi:hypothetical protein [Aquibacillus sediminis]|uniref:hypothetical protein n=1 Tax=Aquibacillus sediminis TaxID=2574734 RepID=UPI001108321A|nr:hypothetical protein [Aquibacillus sediminis]